LQLHVVKHIVVGFVEPLEKCQRFALGHEYWTVELNQLFGRDHEVVPLVLILGQNEFDALEGERLKAHVAGEQVLRQCVETGLGYVEGSDSD